MSYPAQVEGLVNMIKSHYLSIPERECMKPKAEKKIARANNYRLCGETVNHIISECSNVVKKKYKTSTWMRNIIYWELCKRLKFGHPGKWCMHTLEFVLENETHKFSGILRYKRIIQS